MQYLHLLIGLNIRPKIQLSLPVLDVKHKEFLCLVYFVNFERGFFLQNVSKKIFSQISTKHLLCF